MIILQRRIASDAADAKLSCLLCKC